MNEAWYLYFLAGFVIAWALKVWIDWKFKAEVKENIAFDESDRIAVVDEGEGG